MLLNALKAIVELTPTQKDDEFLAQLESFIDKNPQLLPMIFKLFISFARAKNDKE